MLSFIRKSLHKFDKWSEVDLMSFGGSERLSSERIELGRYDGREYNLREGGNLWQFDADSLPSFFVSRASIVRMKSATILSYVQAGMTPKSNLLILCGSKFVQFPFKISWGYQSLKRKARMALTNKHLKEGNVVVLGAMNSANYYHFIVDVIGDLCFVRKNSNIIVEKWVVLASRNAWRERLLSLAGLDLGNVIFAGEHEPMKCCLFVPLRSKGSSTLSSPIIINAIREQFNVDQRAVPGWRKIFISRSDAPTRRLLNAEKLFSPLSDLGFQQYTLSELSVDEQMKLFSEAGVVVAEHGAGLANLLWCAAGTHVIDIHRGSPSVSCFKAISETINLNYVPIFETELGSNSQDDWSVSTSCIEQVLSAIKSVGVR